MNEDDEIVEDRALKKSIGEVLGKATGQAREISFRCGLHGQQQLKSIIFAGLLLKCGCSVTHVDGGWVFQTAGERKKGLRGQVRIKRGFGGF